MSHFSDDSWKVYDKKLNKFYSEYRTYFESLNVLGSAKSRSFDFDLWLQNDGNALATDLDVFLSFPVQIKFIGKKGTKECVPLEKGVEPPEPPESPTPFEIPIRQPQFDFLSNLTNISGISSAQRDDWTPRVTIHRDNSCEIRTQLKKLKHGHRVCLGKFIAVFGSFECIAPFHAEFTISTSELPEMIAGQLPFIARLRATEHDE